MAQSNPAEAVKNLFQTPELKSKIGFTLLALVIYRLGAHITAPGIDVQALIDFFQNQQAGGLARALRLFTGGGLSRATVFALGIMPVHLRRASSSRSWRPSCRRSRRCSARKRGGTRSRSTRATSRWRIAVLQAWGYALFTESLQGAVAHPGIRLPPADGALPHHGRDVRHVAGRADHRARRRQRRVAADLLLDRRADLAGHRADVRVRADGRDGAVPKLVLLGIVMVLVVAGTVAITVAARRVPIQIPQRTMARGRQRESAKNFIPLRMNAANVMPIIFAQTVIVVPGTLAQFSKNPRGAGDRRVLAAAAPGWYYRAVGGADPVLHVLLHVDHLQPDRHRGEPEEAGRIHSRREAGRAGRRSTSTGWSRASRFPGAVFLTLIALLPIVISDVINVPFRFGGTSLLIVVGVGLDTVQVVQQQLLIRKYDGFMKKGPREVPRPRRDPCEHLTALLLDTHAKRARTMKTAHEHRPARPARRRKGHAGRAHRRAARHSQARHRRRAARRRARGHAARARGEGGHGARRPRSRLRDPRHHEGGARASRARRRASCSTASCARCRRPRGSSACSASSGASVDAVLLFEVGEDELVRRLSARTTCEGCQTPYTGREPGTACEKCGGNARAPQGRRAGGDPHAHRGLSRADGAGGRRGTSTRTARCAAAIDAVGAWYE